VTLGRLLGLELDATPSAWLTCAGLGCSLFALAKRCLALRPVAALAFAAEVVLLHVMSVLIHHLGHAAAARRTGHSMRGIRFYGPLASSLYPDDEPPLPTGVHVRRALGGPLASGALTLCAASLGRWLPERGSARVVWWIVVLDNLCNFTLGAFVPLGFADGGTLLRLWRTRGERA
jgi:hypothetical protein